MRILILDDDFNRHQVFRRIHMREPGGGSVVISAQRYFDFVRELERESKWDLIHLDHDIGDAINADTYQDGWDKIQPFDGCHAVMAILSAVGAEITTVTRVIVHSHNNVCAPEMVKGLTRFEIEAVWLPFGEVPL